MSQKPPQTPRPLNRPTPSPKQQQAGSDPYEDVLLIRDVPTSPGGDTEVTVAESQVAEYEQAGWRRA